MSTALPLPPRAVCHLCGNDEEITVTGLAIPGRWLYICSAIGKFHVEPYQWNIPCEQPLAAGDGITAELGLYDDLPRCVTPGEPWVEYGIVEHRYKRLRPDVYYDELLPRYGHTKIGPKRFTTSSFIAAALGHLERDGILAWSQTKATGYWAYNGVISSWAVPPEPPADQRLTWVEFAGDQGLDPQDWVLDRRSDTTRGER